MVTINAARTLGLDNITGSLTPGKRDDLIMLDRSDLNFSSGRRPEHLIIEATQPQNVDLVAIDGKILKRNGQLTGMDVDEIVKNAQASFEMLKESN